MKKILFAIFSFFVFPLLSFAVSNVDYDISNYYVKANILENGNLKVKELIVLDGSFNGYERNIKYANNALSGYDEINFEHSPIYNMDGVKDVHISAKYMNGVSYNNIDDNDFEDFSEVLSAYSGDKRKYTHRSDYDGEVYRMYYESSGKKVGFLIEYTLENAVVMHNDVAELYWQLISPDADYNDEYKDFIVKVYLPGKDTSESFLYWIHGPLNGDSSTINDDVTGVNANIGKLAKGDDFDVRITFDKVLITNDSSLDHTYVNALTCTSECNYRNLIDVENDRSDERDREIQRIKNIYNFFKYLSEIVCGFIVFSFIFIKFIIARKPKVDFDAQYYREFIDDYNVEVVDYLFKKNLTPNALSAAIMNLIYLKKVKAEEIVDPKKPDKKDKDYKFTIVDREGLDEPNTKLVEFLFDTVGHGDEFTTTGLKKYASSLSTGNKFNKSYTSWVNIVTNNGKGQNFFKSKTKAYVFAVIALIISLIMSFAGGSLGVDFPLVYLDIVFAIILLAYVIKLKLYTEKGTLHFKKWTAFKNFLKDFGSFDIKELPEVALWERYLVYSIIFGLAKKVQKDMNVKINELGEVSQSFDTTFTHIYLYDSIQSSFARSVHQGRQQYAASRANAYSSSSGRGFGGGFSSGGGFGGGGGGGHGF